MRRLALAFALTVLAPLAHAQVFEGYITFSPTHASSVQAGTASTTAGYTQQYASYWVPAIGGGVTLNFLPVGPVKLGFDLRGSTKQGVNGVDTALFGLKLAVKPPLLPIKPYVQISGGYVATRTGNLSTTQVGSTTTALGGTATNKYAAFEAIAGIDYHLVPFIDLRLVEVGAGKGYDVGGISFGTVTNSGQNLTLFTINTGVVVHF